VEYKAACRLLLNREVASLNEFGTFFGLGTTHHLRGSVNPDPEIQMALEKSLWLPPDMIEIW